MPRDTLSQPFFGRKGSGPMLPIEMMGCCGGKQDQQRLLMDHKSSGEMNSIIQVCCASDDDATKRVAKTQAVKTDIKYLSIVVINFLIF